MADQGISIPETMQASIFKKFTKSKRTRTEGAQTTYFGLFIVIRIVVRHDGKIWFESAEYIGTTFCVRLPLL